jgi:hypothetical protein
MQPVTYAPFCAFINAQPPAPAASPAIVYVLRRLTEEREIEFARYRDARLVIERVARLRHGQPGTFVVSREVHHKDGNASLPPRLRMDVLRLVVPPQGHPHA